MDSSVETICSQLTLNEKIKLMSGKSMWTLNDIERVGLPSIRVSDGPQGVRRPLTDLTAIESFPATCFPTACAIACSFNKQLAESVGKALSKECREQDVNILLGPGMNIKRHPRGGRNFEYLSEDPVVSGHMAAAMVTGIQSSGHVGACIKHVCVNNQESWRFRVNALVDERTLREIYLSGFQHVVQTASPWTLMCAYNQLNGIYCSESEWLFQEVFRKEWGYQGHVLTDWGATNRRAAGIQAGVDLEMPGTYGIHNSLIKAALKEGSLSQERLDEAVLRNVQLIHKAATAADSADNTDEHILPSSERLAEENHELAYQAALECVVLLKNDNILPLISKQSTKQPPSVALIGDFCREPRFQGMGSSKVNAVTIETILEGIGNHTDEYAFARGFSNDEIEEEDVNDSFSCGQSTTETDDPIKLIEDAVQVARAAEVVIVNAGVPEIYESEGFDREHLNLPAQHNELINKICEVNENVIVILSIGGPVILPPWKDKVKAIINGYLLGQAGGRALLDIVFGVVSPSGKLAETFPLVPEDIPSDKYFPGNSHTVEYREGLNIGYRYYDTANLPVLYPFGHGLSYTTFSYSACEYSVVDGPSNGDNNSDNIVIKVHCEITNSGNARGAEVVQLYVRNDNTSSERPVYHPEHQLKDFHKTKVLSPGESEYITFNLTASAFAFYDIGWSDWILEEGSRYEIQLAASSRDIRWTGTIENSVISQLESCSVRSDVPSLDAYESHPSIHSTPKGSLKHPLVVTDDEFRDMLGRDPSEYMTLSTRTLLGEAPIESSLLLSTRSVSTAASQNDEQELPLLPYNIPLIHRNSFLEEIEKNGCFASLFVRIVVKTMETEMEDPNNKRQQKMIREVARNLPLRCLATFSRGGMSFDVLDSLIAMFNGQYCNAVGHLSMSARNSASSLCGMR